jgi:isoleucyl-tRNA synthetase
LALIRDALLKLMAPILSFTAEEAWKILHPADPTIFVHTWTEVIPDVPGADALVARWDRILEVRALVQKELEAVRQAGGIGSSLQAEVDIVADREHYPALASLGDDLRFVLITSAASVRRGDALTIAVGTSHAPKCERCWHWRSDVGSDAAHPTLCGRCVANLYGAGEARSHA